MGVCCLPGEHDPDPKRRLVQVTRQTVLEYLRAAYSMEEFESLGFWERLNTAIAEGGGCGP